MTDTGFSALMNSVSGGSRLVGIDFAAGVGSAPDGPGGGGVCELVAPDGGCEGWGIDFGGRDGCAGGAL